MQFYAKQPSGAIHDITIVNDKYTNAWEGGLIRHGLRLTFRFNKRNIQNLRLSDTEKVWLVNAINKRVYSDFTPHRHSRVNVVIKPYGVGVIVYLTIKNNTHTTYIDERVSL